MSDSIGKPELVWGEDGTIRSEHFDDVYYSVEGGAAETEYVFLKANGLPDRFKECDSVFTIAETGFGTGLNFYVSWHAWRRLREQSQIHTKAKLHFISFEKYPLDAGDIEKAACFFDDFGKMGKTLATTYPQVKPGIHEIVLEEEAIELTLVFGDINQTIQHMSFQADAWYLDGFSPSKNNEMWTDLLFEAMGKRTAEKGTVATFTSAGFVRRGLIANGFDMRKIKGFGRKREMICGVFNA